MLGDARRSRRRIAVAGARSPSARVPQAALLVTSRPSFRLGALALVAALLGLAGARAQAQSFDVQQLRLVPNQNDRLDPVFSDPLLRPRLTLYLQHR